MQIHSPNITALAVAMLVVSTLCAPTASAQKLTGKKILKKEEDNRSDSEISISEMTIVHKSGAKRVRKIKCWMKGGDSTLVRFLSPANVKGTGFLSLDDDNKWLYLPALRKVRRIATKEKGGSFMGSDFSYDDVGSGSLSEDYTAKLLSIEKYKERDCYVLEIIPKDTKDATYSKLKRWIDKENFYSVKTEYFDRHKDLLKVMRSSGFEKKEGVWTIKKMEMKNVQKGSKTIIVMKEIQINPQIPDNMFTTRQLEKK